MPFFAPSTLPNPRYATVLVVLTDALAGALDIYPLGAIF